MTIDLSELNRRIKKVMSAPLDEKGELDGDDSTHYEIRNLGDGLFIKLEFYKDSYGGSEFTGMQFVQPKEIVISKFEAI
jgi:hypothetical protein